MIPLTEAELLRMQAIQAKATPGPCQVNRFDESSGTINYQVQQIETGVVLCEFPDLTSPNPRAKQDAAFDAHARTDWPRVTEWALEARKLLMTILEMPAVKRGDYDDGSPWIRIQINEAWIQAARRLLGEL